MPLDDETDMKCNERTTEMFFCHSMSLDVECQHSTSSDIEFKTCTHLSPSLHLRFKCLIFSVCSQKLFLL